MANHKSALKRARQNEQRNLRNRAQRSALRTAIKKFRVSLEGEAKVPETDLHSVMSVVDSAGAKGILTSKTAARTISRLSRAWQRHSA